MGVPGIPNPTVLGVTHWWSRAIAQLEGSRGGCEGRSHGRYVDVGLITDTRVGREDSRTGKKSGAEFLRSWEFFALIMQRDGVVWYEDVAWDHVAHVHRSATTETSRESKREFFYDVRAPC